MSAGIYGLCRRVPAIMCADLAGMVDSQTRLTGHCTVSTQQAPLCLLMLKSTQRGLQGLQNTERRRCAWPRHLRRHQAVHGASEALLRQIHNAQPQKGRHHHSLGQVGSRSDSTQHARCSQHCPCARLVCSTGLQTLAVRAWPGF